MMVPVCVESTRASPWTVGEVLRDGAQRMPVKASPQQWKVLRALQACRTGALGGSTYQCQRCQQHHSIAFGCGNRHCPDCQGRLALDWLKQQQSRLLPVPYFHLVFTLPHELNPLIRQNREVLYDLLFEAASQTLLEFGRNRFQGEIGLTMVLHTWGQLMEEHYHGHGIVTGGGWDEDGGWHEVRDRRYLFSVRALSRVYRAKFCEGLQELRKANRLEYHGEQAALNEESKFQALVRQSTRNQWVVYAKKPFSGPETVLKYLSNYTHRVGVSSKRILDLDPVNHLVTFRYRDYADNGKVKTQSLDTGEFARRFCLHVLPKGFCKVRHYGLLANRGREARLAKVRKAVEAAKPRRIRKTNLESIAPALALKIQCPYCGSEDQRLVRVVRASSQGQPRVDSS